MTGSTIFLKDEVFVIPFAQFHEPWKELLRQSIDISDLINITVNKDQWPKTASPKAAPNHYTAFAPFCRWDNMLEIVPFSCFTKYPDPSTVTFAIVTGLIRLNNTAPLLLGPIDSFLGPVKPSLSIFFGKCWFVCRKVETEANVLQVSDQCRSRHVDLMNSQLRIHTIVCSKWVLYGYGYQSLFISFSQFLGAPICCVIVG